MKHPKIRWTAVAAMLAIMLSACNTVDSSTPDAGLEDLPGTPAESSPANDPVAEDNLPTDDAILQTVLDQVESLNLCDGFFDPAVAAAESQVYRMGDQVLVELHCAFAAYQEVYAYVMYQADGTLQPLMLDVFYPDGTGQFERTSELTVGGLATFDTTQDRLTVFSKARGIGDCGSLAEYRWTGRELELETFRYQECSDSAEEFVDPANYPQIYP